MKPTLHVRSTFVAFATVTTSSLVLAQGSFTTSGQGCGLACNSNAIYQRLPAGAWDLDQRSILFRNDGVAWTAQDGAATHPFIAPTPGATPIPAPCGSHACIEGPYPLGFTFTYPGGAGATTQVSVDSDGGVVLEPGSLGPRRFFEDAPSVACLYADLLPGNGGSRWNYEHHTVGANTVFVVTWVGVPEVQSNPFGPPGGSNTFQCQIWDNNDLVIAHASTNGAASLGPALVGVSSGGGQGDCGEVDFSVDLAAGIATTPPFQPGGDLTLSATAGATFVPGGIYTITAENVQPSAVTVLAFGSTLPTPIPLGPFGALPACVLQILPRFTVPMADIGAGRAELTANVPNSATQIGASIDVQALALVQPPNPNPLPGQVPLFVSDRGTLTVGPVLNDEPQDAISIGDGVVAGSIRGATTSVNRPSCGSFLVRNIDVWYSYTASCTGTAIASLCNNGGSAFLLYDALAAFDGSLNELVCGDSTQSPCIASEIAFPVVAGQSYYVAVAARDDPVANTFILSMTCVPPPANDEPAAAFAIGDGVTPGTTVSATTSTPTGSCGAMGADVWYVYSATCGGTLTVSTDIADGGYTAYDSVIALFTGTVGSLSQQACNNDAAIFSNASRATYTVTAGETVYIAIGGYSGDSGSFDLFVGCQ